LPLTYRDRGTSGTQLDVLCGDIRHCERLQGDVLIKGGRRSLLELDVLFHGAPAGV
jgi:hypothetical protein